VVRLREGGRGIGCRTESRMSDRRIPVPRTFAAVPGRPSAGIRFGRGEGTADIIRSSSTAALPAPGHAHKIPHLREPRHDVSALRQGMRQPHGRPPGSTGWPRPVFLQRLLAARRGRHWRRRAPVDPWRSPDVPPDGGAGCSPVGRQGVMPQLPGPPPPRPGWARPRTRTTSLVLPSGVRPGISPLRVRPPLPRHCPSVACL
jgi:hypothetical protein